MYKNIFNSEQSWVTYGEEGGLAHVPTQVDKTRHVYKHHVIQEVEVLD